MAGKAYIKNSSTQWKIIKKAYYKVGQSWVPIQKAYVKVGNLWKKVFDSASQAPIGTLTRILYKGYAQNGGEYVGDLPSSWVQMGPDTATWGTASPTYLWGEDGTWDANGGTISFYRRGFYYNSTNDRNTYTLITGTNAEGNVDAGGGGDKLRNSNGYITDYNDKYLWYVTSATNTAGVTGFSAANPTYVTRQSPEFSLNNPDNFYFQDPSSVPSGGISKFDFYIADEWYKRIDKSKSFMEFYILNNQNDGLESGTKIGNNIYLDTITSAVVNDVLYGTYDFSVPSSSAYLGKYLAARMTLRNSYTEWYIYTPVEGNIQVSTGKITATPVVEVAPTITKKDGNQTQGYYLTGNAGRWTPDATSVEYGWQYSNDGETGWTDVRYATFAGGFGFVYPVFVGTATSENGSYDYLIPSTFYTNSSGSTTPSNGKYLRFWSQGAVDGVKAVKTYTAAIGPIYKPPTSPGKPDIAYYSAGANSGVIVAGFVWDASTSFYRYQIERKADGTAIWGLLKDNITTNGGWFSKETATVPLGKATYRIVAVNEDGVKAYSLETEFTASGLPGAFNINSATKGLSYQSAFSTAFQRDLRTFWGSSVNAEYYAVRYQGTNTAPGVANRELTWTEIQPDFNEWTYTTPAPATDDTKANIRSLRAASLQYAYGTYTLFTTGEHNLSVSQNVWIDFGTQSPSESGIYFVTGLAGTSGFTFAAKSYAPVVYSSTYRPEVSFGWFTQDDYPDRGGIYSGGPRQADNYLYYRVSVRAENSASVAEANPTYNNGGTESNLQWVEVSGSGPQGLSISEDSKGGTYVNVTASITSSGSSAFSKYQWSTDNSTWTDDATSPVNVTGLTKATAYTIYIRAVNAEGLFSDTKTLSVTTLSGVGAFNVLSATKGKISASVTNKRRITATWENPTDGVYYELQVEGSNNAPSAATRTWTVLQSVATSPYIDKPATGNATGTYDADNYSYYRVAVRARDINRDSSTWSYSNGGTAADALVYFEATGTAPSAITMPTSATVTKTSLSIDYTLPTGTSTGSAPLNKTEYKNGSSGTWTTTTVDPLVISDLTAGTEYEIFMRATNTDGLVSAEASKKYSTTAVPLAFAINNVEKIDSVSKDVSVSKEITITTSTTKWELGTSTATAFSGGGKYLIEAWPSAVAPGQTQTLTKPTGDSTTPGYKYQTTNAYDFSTYTGYGTLNVRVKATEKAPGTKISWAASTNANSYIVTYKENDSTTNSTSPVLTTTSFEKTYGFSDPVKIEVVKVTAYSKADGTGDSVEGTLPTTKFATGSQTWGTGVTKSATIAKPFVSPSGTTPRPGFSRFYQTATTSPQQGVNWYWKNPAIDGDGSIVGWDWEIRVSDVTSYTVEPHRWGWLDWTGRTGTPSGTNRGGRPYSTSASPLVWSGSGTTNSNVSNGPWNNRITSTTNLPSSSSPRYGRIRMILLGTNGTYYPQNWTTNI